MGRLMRLTAVGSIHPIADSSTNQSPQDQPAEHAGRIGVKRGGNQSTGGGPANAPNDGFPVILK